jgi:biopolymer transport protein ExbB/TolQ
MMEEVAKLRDGIENGVYGTLMILSGFLPALGFIGTILGMGDALLRADLLFTSPDRQRSISLMTQDLGFAFDTTLVALLCGLIVGLALAYLRMKEKDFLGQVEGYFTEHLLAGLAKKEAPK